MPTTVVQVAQPRYRCDACGNLTRFDVTTSKTTRAFHHYTVGGELQIETEEVLTHQVDDVVCRWCGHGRNVVEMDAEEHGLDDHGLEDHSSEEHASAEHGEPGAQSKVS